MLLDLPELLVVLDKRDLKVLLVSKGLLELLESVEIRAILGRLVALVQQVNLDLRVSEAIQDHPEPLDLLEVQVSLGQQVLLGLEVRPASQGQLVPRVLQDRVDLQELLALQELQALQDRLVVLVRQVQQDRVDPVVTLDRLDSRVTLVRQELSVSQELMAALEQQDNVVIQEILVLQDPKVSRELLVLQETLV